MIDVGLVLPEFALLVLGALLRRWAWRSPQFWVDLERLVYLVLFPVLLVRTTLAADLGAAGAGTVLLAALGATGAGALLAAAVWLLPGTDRSTAASGWQTAFRFNSYLALALVDDQGPAALALMGVLLGVSVPVVNVLAVSALAHGAPSPADGDRRTSAAVRLLGAVVRNPLILATAAGLAGNLAGVTLPGPVDATASRLAAAAVPLGLLTVGAALRGGWFQRGRRLVSAYLALVKLVAVPAAALGLATALGVVGEQRAVLMAFAAVPPATAAYVLTARMGGDGPFVAAQLSLTTVAAVLTLPLWLTLTG
ncbi:AEC family transporter [Geodermatophilus sp. DSM 44513]|uniref:AEC family transporter n=1 Tax=Geodermatophilus sp. DSM 44513 TaxID=1528104 RepID=UPI001283632C|nr:AEC family transporter [Geodermatophilus sp. DSM 44513]WNV76098.1 AEC family transporter [Geodermatophilus sp. DSM 44513]